MDSSKSFHSYKKRRFSLKNLDNSQKNILFIVLGVVIVGLVVFLIFNQKVQAADPLLKMVSGTEYISGEQGQVIVRLQDSKDNAITDADCVLSLLYPDKSFFLIDVNMIPTSVPGNSYHPFITPEREGIYEEHIVCKVTRNDVERELHISYAFHVSTGLNLIVEVSRTQKEQYDNLVNRVNQLDANMSSKMQEIDYKLNDVQTYIDTNVMTEVNNLSLDINDVNSSINDSMDGIEARMNDAMIENFDSLYQRFKDSYNAMASIFSGE